jgi:PPK2 family polyphosphate:nucleotide phosphotransferase
MSSQSFSERYRIKPDSKVDLGKFDPDEHESQPGDPEAAHEIAIISKRLGDLQENLYASQKSSILICLQGLDAAGKDGTIKHVCGSLNPQGCRVASFKQPTHDELAHDFLWRVHKVAPENGEIVVFNRSHYEDVLVVRVHDLVPKHVWHARYKRINAFEKGLSENHTTILKFFLHISKEEQLKRFGDRLTDPKKNWKISESDYSERALWSEYVKAYEEVFERCSTDVAPWFIIPSNHKWYRDLVIGKIFMEHLERLKAPYPAPSVDLQEIRKKYHSQPDS